MFVSKAIFRIGLVFGLFFVLGFSSHAEAFYRSGDRGSEVSQIQAALFKLGYDIKSVDGVFGGNTVAAVKAFQAKENIAVDGIVGQETYVKLMQKPMPVSRAGLLDSIRRLVSVALSYQGVPYYFGGTTPNGFDCSGYTRFVFAKIGISLPRMADEQYYAGNNISKTDLQTGDLVYFSTYEPGISHVGIYLGQGQFISSTSSAGVAVRSIYDPYYWGPRYVGANRVL